MLALMRELVGKIRNDTPVVRSRAEPWRELIGSSESPALALPDRIMAMIVSTGSVVLVTSRLAMRVEDMISSRTENPWSLTPACVAAIRNALTRVLRSIDGLILADVRIFAMMISRSLVDVAISASSDRISESMVSIYEAVTN